ncbi:Hypothetical protein GLP15_2149 [Giardia lamblia P15]|uniref:Chromosome segregation ATPase n=1 Tax=Giardia intestinalis (strain P15) TaxID=658858 RepID=E1F6Z7_GIAIA|nr:Hypothetical protein GLP15_2149 [Giardia lamblia P15]
MQFTSRLREQDNDASSSVHQLKGLSDRRSSSTATYSPSHMVNLREELGGAITISNVGDIIEHSKCPYVIPKLTNARYKLPPILDSGLPKVRISEEEQAEMNTYTPFIHGDPTRNGAFVYETNNPIDKDMCRSTILAREKTFTERASMGNWQTTTVKDDIDRIRTHIVGSNGDKVGTIKVAKTPASRLMNLKLSIERLISLDGFDPLFSNDPGAPDEEAGVPIQTFDHLEQEICNHTKLDCFPTDILTDSEQDEDKGVTTSGEPGDLSPAEHKFKQLNPVLQRERQSISDTGQLPVKISNHVLHYRTNMKVVEQLDKIRNMKEKSATIIKDHEAQRTSVICFDKAPLGRVVNPEEYTTVAELIADINADEQDPLGLISNESSLKSGQAISELEAFVMAFDSAVELLQQKYDEYESLQGDQRLESISGFYSQLPGLLNTLERSKDYLVARSVRRTGKVDLLKSQARDMEKRLKITLEENKNLYKELSDLRTSYDKVKESLTNTIGSLDSLQYAKAKVERELNSLQDNYEAMKKTRIAMEVEMGELALEKDEAFARSKRLTVAAGRLRTIADSAVTRAQNAEKRVILEIKAKQELEKAYKKASEETSFLMQKLKRQDIQYKGELQELEHEIAKLRAVIEDLNAAEDFQAIDTRTVIRSIMESGNASKIMQMAAETVETLSLPETIIHICSSCPEIDQLGLACLIHLLRTLRDPPTIHHFFTIINKEPLITVVRKAVGVQTVTQSKTSYESYPAAFAPKNVSLKNLYSKQLGQAIPAYALDYNLPDSVAGKGGGTKPDLVKEERAAIKNVLKTAAGDAGIDILGDEHVIDTGLVLGNHGAEGPLNIADLINQTVSVHNSAFRTSKSNKQLAPTASNTVQSGEKERTRIFSTNKDLNEEDGKLKKVSKKRSSKPSIDKTKSSGMQKGKDTVKTATIAQSQQRNQELVASRDSCAESNSVSDLVYSASDEFGLVIDVPSPNKKQDPTVSYVRETSLELETLSAEDFERMMTILTDNMESARIAAQIKMVLSYMLFKSAFCDEFKYLFLDFYNSYRNDFAKPSMTDEEKQDVVFSFVDDFKLRMRILDDERTEISHLSSIPYNLLDSDYAQGDKHLNDLPSTIEEKDNSEAVTLDHTVHAQERPQGVTQLNTVGVEAKVTTSKPRRKLTFIVPMVSRATEHMYADILVAEDLDCEPELQLDNCYADECVAAEEITSDKQSFIVDQSCSQPHVTEVSDQAAQQIIATQQHITRHAYIDAAGKTRLNDTTNAKATKLKNIKKGFAETIRRRGGVLKDGKASAENVDNLGPSIPAPEQVKSIMSRIGPILKKEDKKLLYKGFKRRSSEAPAQKEKDAAGPVRELPPVSAQHAQKQRSCSSPNSSDRPTLRHLGLETVPPTVVDEGLSAIVFSDEHPRCISRATSAIVTIHSDVAQSSAYFSQEAMESFDNAMKHAELKDFPGGFTMAFYSTKDALERNAENALASSHSLSDVKGSVSKHVPDSVVDLFSSNQGLQQSLRPSSNTDLLVYTRNSSAYDTKPSRVFHSEPPGYDTNSVPDGITNPMEKDPVHRETSSTVPINVGGSSSLKQLSEQSISRLGTGRQLIDEQLPASTSTSKHFLAYLRDAKGSPVPILVQGTKFYGNLQNSDVEVIFSNPGDIATENCPKSIPKATHLLSANQEILSTNKAPGQMVSATSDLIFSMRTSANGKSKTEESIHQLSDSSSWKDQLNELTNLDEELNTLNVELQELIDRKSTGSTSPNSRSVNLRSQSKLRALSLEECAVQTDITCVSRELLHEGVIIDRSESLPSIRPETMVDLHIIVSSQSDQHDKVTDVISDKPLLQWNDVLERNPVLYHSSFISGYAFRHYPRNDPAMRYNFAKQEEIQLFIQSFSQLIQTDVISICSSDKDVSIYKPLFTPLKAPKIVSVQTDVYSYHIDKLVSAVRLAREVTNPREYLRYDNPRHLRGVDVSCINMNTKSSLPAIDTSHYATVQPEGLQNTRQSLTLHTETTQVTGNSILPGLIGPKNLPLLPSARLLQEAQGKKTRKSVLADFADNPLLATQQSTLPDSEDSQPHPDTSGLLAAGGLNPLKYPRTSVVEDFLYMNNQLTSANKADNAVNGAPSGKRNLLQVTPLFPFQSDMNLVEHPDKYLNSSLNTSLDDQDDEPDLTLGGQRQELNTLLRQTSSNKFARIVNKLRRDSSGGFLLHADSLAVPEAEAEGDSKKYIQVTQPGLLPGNSEHAKLLSAAYLNVLAQPESRFISNFGVSPIRPFVIKNKANTRKLFGSDPHVANYATISAGISPSEIRNIIQNSNVLFAKQRRPVSKAINSVIGVVDNTDPSSHYKALSTGTKALTNVFVTAPESPAHSPIIKPGHQDRKQPITNDLLIVTSINNVPSTDSKLMQFTGPIPIGSVPHPRYGSLTYMQANPLNIAPYCYFLMQTTLDKIFAKYTLSTNSNQTSLLQMQESSDDKVLKPANTATRQIMCSPCLLSNRVKFHKDLAATSVLQKATLNQIDSELKRTQDASMGSPIVKPLAKQPATLLPTVGDQISFIRLSSASLHYASDRGMLDVDKGAGSSHDLMAPIDSLPIIFKLLEQVTLTPTQIITSLVSKQAYIRIPITACYLKSLIWTLKIIRMVLYKRQMATETIIIARHDEHKAEHLAEKNLLNTSVGAAPVADEHITTAYEFMLVPGELCREDAESLPHFLVYWCKSRYGLRSLVSSLLYCIIANVVFYQYENDEIYLFARMLFSDLDNDYFLAYLDLRRSLQLNTYVADSAKELRDASINILELIPITSIEPLLSIMFTNWDRARREDLAASIIGSVYDRYTRSAEQHKELTIPFSRVVAIIFYAYSSFRKTLYQALQTILLHFGREHGCVNRINEAAFRELCSHTIKRWNSEIIAEQFYSFSHVEEILSPTALIRSAPSASSFTQLAGKPTTLILQDNEEELAHKQTAQRLMDMDNFIDMFVSNQLGRFLTLSTDILETSVDSEVKRSIYIAMRLFDRLKSLSEEASKQLMCEDILNGTARRVGVIRKMKDNLAAVASDITCYDHHHALLSIKHAIDTILVGLLEVDVDSVSAALGGAITSLEGYFASQIVDDIA